MDSDVAISILKGIIEFVDVNNISEEYEQKNVAKVVSFSNLEQYLKTNMSIEYDIIERHYGELFYFLMHKGRRVVSEEWDSRFKYEVMTVKKYKKDSRFVSNCFPQLKQMLFHNSNLFVIYLLDTEIKHHSLIKEYHIITESLSDQINVCYEQQFLTESAYSTRRDIRDSVNSMIQDRFCDTKVTVELIGSSHTQLALTESDVNLGIRIPNHLITADAYLCNTSNWKDSVYDVYCLAQRLRDMGMVATLPIVKAKICKFTDPVSKLNCVVGVDSGLVFERDQLIAEYLKLDKRIRPLICSVLYFTRSQKINKSLRIGQLSTYSYIIMILHFIMCGVKNPIIPSLQDLSSYCISSECRYKRNDAVLSTFFNNKIMNVEVRFHDCVRTVNRKTNLYNDFNFNDTEIETGDNIQHTTWHCENNDNLGSLFIDFLDYYSVKKNFKRVSIICDDGDLVNVIERDWRDFNVGIQDPFLVKKKHWNEL